MRIGRLVLLGSAASLLAAPAGFAQQATFDLDPARTEIAVTLGATLHTVHGSFKLRRGTITFDRSTGKAGGAVVIDASSGDTGNMDRDRNMHRDVLESAVYPEITFTPSEIEGQLAEAGDSRIQIRGTVGIHGGNHEVAIPAKVHVSADELTAEMSFEVPYVKWGMKNPSNLLLRVSQIVRVSVRAAGRLTAAAPN